MIFAKGAGHIRTDLFDRQGGGVTCAPCSGSTSPRVDTAARTRGNSFASVRGAEHRPVVHFAPCRHDAGQRGVYVCPTPWQEGRYTCASLRRGEGGRGRYLRPLHRIHFAQGRHGKNLWETHLLQCAVPNIASPRGSSPPKIGRGFLVPR